MNRTCLTASIVLAILILLAMLVDVPLSQWVAAKHTPGDVRKLLGLAEVFAHGLGVFFILLAVWVLDPARRRVLARIACCAWGGGLAADVVKLFVYRTRPFRLGLEQFSGTAWDTFQLLPPINWQTASQSFPSAHTAAAVGLAAGLSFAYPRGRLFFFLVASLAGLQRIEFLHHYLSDVVGGALVGALWSCLCLHPRGLGFFFERWEQRLPNA